MSKTQAIVDAALIGLLIVGYIVLSALHDDGTALLYIIGGAAGRSGVQSVVGTAEKRNGG